MIVAANRKIPINKPSITELEVSYVNDAIRNGWGEKCYDYIHRFEKGFAHYQKTQYALATSSCTGAIHLALMAMGIKAGDEVIVPELTWIASVEPVLYIGAKPVFVDVLADTWCLDPQKVRNAITPRTRAIMAVHLYGNVCDMDAIMKIAREKDIKVIEDAAEGLGSECNGVKAGSIGNVGVFSFHGTKTLSTGEGGILVTNDKLIHEKAKVLNDHGRDASDPQHKMFWMRNYGFKYKMSNLQAAMGVAQVERVEELVAKKRQIFIWYSEFLNDVPCKMNPERPGTKNGYWLPTVVFDNGIQFDREAFFAFMRGRGIDSRPFFYPLSSLPMFERNNLNSVAYSIYGRGVNLPSYHDITRDEVEFVCNGISEFLTKR